MYLIEPSKGCVLLRVLLTYSTTVVNGPTHYSHDIEPPASTCSVLPVEGVWQGGGVRRWALLLAGKLLFYNEGVIVNNYWHHGRQEAGHHLQILRAGAQEGKWTPTTKAGFNTMIFIWLLDTTDSLSNHLHTERFSSENRT